MAAAAATTTTETIWMPPLTTGPPSNIYAAVVTAAPSATEYLLACEQSFATPYPEECAKLESWTLTHGPSTMRLDMVSETIDCQRGDEGALCTVHVAGNPAPDGVSTTSIANVESASWYTAVTVVPRPDQDEDQDLDDDFESDEEEDEDEDGDRDWAWAELLKKRDASPTTTSGKCRPTNSKVKRDPKRGSSSGGRGRSGKGGSNKGKGPGSVGRSSGSGRGSRRKGAGAASTNNDDDCDSAAAGGAVANLKLTGVLAVAAVGFVLFGL